MDLTQSGTSHATGLRYERANEIQVSQAENRLWRKEFRSDVKTKKEIWETVTAITFLMFYVGTIIYCLIMTFFPQLFLPLAILLMLLPAIGLVGSNMKRENLARLLQNLSSPEDD